MSEDESAGDPVCFASKLVGGHVVDPQTRLDVSRFRTSERTRLYALRKQLSSTARAAKTEALLAHLRSFLTAQNFDTIAVYWPIRGEPDVRPLMTELAQAGRKVLLPAVVTPEAPLEFHYWYPGQKMVRGRWNIPVPARAERFDPDVVVSPFVGIDAQLYRLGNGGGYYDRTLAAFAEKPLTIGVGFEEARIQTIFPMPWDVAMDTVITDTG